MQPITIENYEAFLLDYNDGQLDKNEIEQLRLFLNKNHLPALVEYNPMLTLPDTNLQMQDKWGLMKSEIEELNYTEYVLIAKTEGVATSQELINANEIIKTKQGAELLIQLNNAKLKPQVEVYFKNKKTLLRKQKVLFLSNPRWAAIAAVLMVALGVGWMLVPEQVVNTNPAIAQINKVTKTEITTNDTIASDKVETVIDNNSNDNVTQYKNEKVNEPKTSPVEDKKIDAKERYRNAQKPLQKTLLDEQKPELASKDKSNKNVENTELNNAINTIKPQVASVEKVDIETENDNALASNNNVQMYRYNQNEDKSTSSKKNEKSNSSDKSKNISKLIKMLSNNKVTASYDDIGKKGYKVGIGEFELSYNK
jgi:hypothetical protein